MSKIDSMRQYALENLKMFGITPMRRILPPELFQAAQPNLMRSSVMLIPEVVFWLMATVSLAQKSMAGSISAFWADFRGTMPFLSPTPITEEAFCTARKKLKLRFFRNIFKSVIRRYQDNSLADRYRWKGFRLLGIDGMKNGVTIIFKAEKVFPASIQLQRRLQVRSGAVSWFGGIVGWHML